MSQRHRVWAQTVRELHQAMVRQVGVRQAMELHQAMVRQVGVHQALALHLVSACQVEALVTVLHQAMEHQGMELMQTGRQGEVRWQV